MSAVSTPPARGRRLGFAHIEEPDRRSVARTLAGDTGAFGDLVQEHQQVVHRVAARIVGGHDADDVAQEAFLRAFNRLEQYRGDSSFRSWLLQITYNTAIDAANRRKPEPASAAPEQQELAERGPVMKLEERERRERLESKLDMLRPEHRAVIVLRDLEGLPYEDIATATDSPLGSVKGRLHRARAELIDLMRHNTYDWQLPQ